MKKILFYTANGVGLGHIRRSSLIAKSILETEEDSRVFFVSMCEDASFLEDFKIPYKKLIPVSDEIIKDYEENKRCKKINEDDLRRVIEDFSPDKIVLDIHVFANFSFPNLLLSEEFEDIEKILIYRMTNKKSFVFNFEKFADKFEIFKKIIIPHSKEEIERVLRSKDYRKCLEDPRIYFSGPIFRKINKKALAEVKNRYKINAKDFNIAIALGGGGELKMGKCETPAGIILKFLETYDSLKESFDRVNIKINIVTGPLFKYNEIINNIKKKYSPNIKIVVFEKYLMELFAASDLVISPIGYNAGNEIIEAETPALLIPLLRGEDNGREQMERAKYLKEFGIVSVFDLNTEDSFQEKILDCIKNKDKMKKAFSAFRRPRRGNKKAAKLILN